MCIYKGRVSKMKTIKFSMTKILICVVTAIAISLPYSYLSFADGTDDKNDKLSANQSYTFSPGYLNAAKQKADSILRQKSPEKGLIDKKIENAQGKLDSKIDEVSGMNEKLDPNLQQRSSIIEDASPAASAIADSANSDVNIGSGEYKVIESGKLISEIIGGTKYIYVGFDNAGKSSISEAISIASQGDKIIIKGGTYNESITVKDGVSLYGGYGENGECDLLSTPTVINGSLTADSIQYDTEISGFTINCASGNQESELLGSGISTIVYLTDSNNITLKNNIISGGDLYSVYSNKSNITLANNVFNTEKGLYADSQTNLKPDEPRRMTNFLSLTPQDNAGGTAMYNIISENNDYYGSLGIKVDSDDTALTTDNDYYSTSIGESAKIYYYGVFIYTIDGSASSPNTLFGSGTAYSLSDSSYGQNAIYYSTLFRGAYNDTSMLSNDNRFFANYDAAIAAPILKELLSNDSLSFVDVNGRLSRLTVDELSNGDFQKTALYAMLPKINERQSRVANILAGILANPTDDQKILIDSLKGLIQDLNAVESTTEAGVNPELKKASDSLIQMVANILLAQGVPDLLKEGDISNIKGVFKELDAVKGKLISEYNVSTTPYYDNIKKDIIKNISSMQVNNAFSRTLTEEELKNLPRSEIDKVIQKLKKIEKRSFEAEYIVQQEYKYRKEYLDPSRNKFEEGMKSILRTVTSKLNAALETRKK